MRRLKTNKQTNKNKTKRSRGRQHKLRRQRRVFIAYIAYEAKVPNPLFSYIKDGERRKSRYSTYHQNRRELIPRPDNHLRLAIIAMICCCLPLGIVGVICALQVRVETLTLCSRAFDDYTVNV